MAAASLGDRLVAALIRGGFALVRLLGPDRASGFGGWITQRIGPLLPVHRTALANIRLAFPELDDAAHRRIAREAWNNLGRTACEYVHMDRIWDWDDDRPNHGHITTTPEAIARYIELRDDGKPALVFAAHLANWEIPAIAPARHGIRAAVLYRTPNNPAVARDILALRAGTMGTLIPAGMTAPSRMAKELAEGNHVGMLIDQYFARGPLVPFFGRPTHANPLIAHLARRFDCPVHGARAVRLDGCRFRVDLTEALELPRDAEGKIDVVGATAAMNAVIEGWVRDTPGQWLWMHRRWRGEQAPRQNQA